MKHVFHRHARAELPVAVSGEGVYITDAQGKRYLDASSGAAVSCLGHSDPEVIAVSRRGKVTLEDVFIALTGLEIRA